MRVSAANLHVRNDQLVLVTLQIANGQRNLQIPIDDLCGGGNATVTWNKIDDGHAHHHHAHGDVEDGMMHASPRDMPRD